MKTKIPPRQHTERDNSEDELNAAMEAWRRWHSAGSRRRLSAAIAKWRQLHPFAFAELFDENV